MVDVVAENGKSCIFAHKKTDSKMEFLRMLGTGAAMVTNVYNTCFTIEESSEPDECMLVDGGGGNEILKRFEQTGRKCNCVRSIFVSHNHSDHLLGIVWVVRAIAQELVKDRYVGNLNIYAHPKSLDALRTICGIVMKPKLNSFWDKRIIMHPISDGMEADIMGRRFEFFDIQSTKELQHGFVCRLRNGKRLAFLGDEPMHECNVGRLTDIDYLMQEAYCLHSEADVFHPYEKNHGTALATGRCAQKIGARSVIMMHTEARTIATRRWKYSNECQTVFSGRVYMPNDMEVIEL